VSASFQTPLGFHIAQLTDLKPPRQLTFDEVLPEIQRQLANDKRSAAVEKLTGNLRAAEFVRADRQ
jgi:parvulin-like peptidyl-prolyl isomerase